LAQEVGSLLGFFEGLLKRVDLGDNFVYKNDFHEDAVVGKEILFIFLL
jgi:hypothetical protein